jgi:CDP-paratose 2-epimerase
MKTAVFRMSCIYGIRQFGFEDQGWVAHFVIANLFKRPIKIFGDGKQVRDLLYVTDLVEAYDKFFRSNVRHDVYTIGGGPEKTASLLEFIEHIENYTGIKMKYKFDDWRPSDQKVYISDIDKVSRSLGWKPKIGPVEGVKLLTEWVKENKELFK